MQSLRTLNDFQKLLGDINWLRPSVGIPTYALQSLFKILFIFFLFLYSISNVIFEVLVFFYFRNFFYFKFMFLFSYMENIVNQQH